MKIFQKGFNYSQDGQGNRLVYHLQGCNMHCPWCANPEGMQVEGTIVSDKEWLLDSICPHNAIHKKQIDRIICKNCMKHECITEHNTKGMYLSFEECKVEDILQEVLENKMMFYDGGGVTFTGGEATVQFIELKKILRLLKENDIHTAIETNGSNSKLESVFSMIDQLIMDCKLIDCAKHKKYTGLSNEIILKNIQAAATEHPNLHIRVPLIGGVNDSLEDRSEFLVFFEKIHGPNVSFELLTYHEFGKKKWEECGWKYQMDQTAYVSPEIAREFKNEIIKMGARYQNT